MWCVGSKTRHLSTRRLCTARALILALLVSGSAIASTPKQFFDKYCITCHNQKLHTAGLALDTLDATQAGAPMPKSGRK